MAIEVLAVDPQSLHLPPGRVSGADPIKFSRQFSRHGRSIEGMPPLNVLRGRGGALQILDGVTRATRVARLFPGQTIEVQVVETRPAHDLGRFPTLGEILP